MISLESSEQRFSHVHGLQPRPKRRLWHPSEIRPIAKRHPLAFVFNSAIPAALRMSTAQMIESDGRRRAARTLAQKSTFGSSCFDFLNHNQIAKFRIFSDF
jgi:hypothetical protein